ncbi:MAG: hypothetical protein A3I75_01285 [Deltaproteobacteria bacterium RIFCSPLOWO2_02_FULL_50_16]|nr:MAG: hypothetical protein A3B79_06670 [Deltaproteobacteria bacterium RIFCSPHIGHO2_02_FULL_50_15]OGQ58019.1 MAG: hypothetical protein A3I75_01285 [Deltaproteobacteria bacterium RIFCSPLOWO2_02_FULL_50_16]OGQ69073.1 MAG: hypothetical protein A3F89_00655 [Deltaproteobacteria bacterium RIFCSPLOWO2_12_FULL_50_11]
MPLLKKISFLPYGLGALSLIFIMTSGCFSSDSFKRRAKTTVEKEEALPLLVARASTKEVVMKLRAAATLEAYDRLEVRNTFGAKVEAVYVDEGAAVNPGDTLLKFNQEENGMKLEVARNELREAEAGIEASNARLGETNRNPGENGEEPVGPSAESLEKQITYLEAKADRARSEIALLDALDRKETITSPMSGIVRRKRVTTGALFAAEDILMEVVQINPIKLKIQLPQEMLAILNVGSEIFFNIPSLRIKKTLARISYVSPEVNPQTGLVEAVCILPNDDGVFKDGLAGEIEIPTDEKTTILMIPEQAIFYESEKSFVYRIVNQIAKKTSIVTGQQTKGDVQIQSGLKEGDIVAIQFPEKLKDGSMVELLTAAP